MTDANPPCPKCGAKAVAIVYGLPGPGLMEAYDRGEIHLGGCVVSEDMPGWHCKACNHEFGKVS